MDMAPTLAQLSGMSLDQLANLTVTSAARRPQPLSEVPASIYVITGDEIRRSGAESLPEALRLAPNLEVARINAYDWTISARGFNSPESANKLLVLVNGRSVYSPLAGTVFWDALDTSVDSVARIEVISGPGGAQWGANAMNGVINIITTTPAQTEGVMAHVSGGPFERHAIARIATTLSAHVDASLTANGFDIGATDPAQASDTSNDAWRGGELAARLEWQDGADTLLATAVAYSNGTYDSAPATAPINPGTSLWGEVAALRWSRGLAGGGNWRIDGTFSHDARVTPALHEFLDAYDLESLYDFGSIGRHHLLTGGEFKLWRETLFSNNAFHFAKPSDSPALGDVFIEDEMRLSRALEFTAGIKAAYNSFSGFDYLPDLRLSWQVDADAMLWAAVSRAVRTPSRIDRELQALPLLAPSPGFQSEKLMAYQLGYRGMPARNMTLSLTAFYNDYADLRSDVLTNGGLPIVLENGISGHSYGLELWGQYEIDPAWRVSLGANWLVRQYRQTPPLVDFSQGQSLGQDPGWQAELRSSADLTERLKFDVDARAIGAVTRFRFGGPKIELVPSYVEADARLAYAVSEDWEIAIAGYNLLHRRHLEVNDPSTTPARDIPRYFAIDLRAHW